MVIDKVNWNTCKICELSKQQICADTKSGEYYSTKYREHIENHNISIEEYFAKYEGISIPSCPCGCNKKLTISKKGGGNFIWRKLACGRNEGIIEWGKNAKETRLGENNPMFGKRPWNKEHNKNNCDKMKKISENRKGIVISEETKNKMSVSAKKRKIHGHTGHKHSELNKQKFRENTLRMIQEGKYKQTRTKPHILFYEMLKRINVKFCEECIEQPWIFDFYLPELNYYIEVDGDYFHSNPKIYPNGPKTKTQKINWYRDIKKNEFCTKNNLKLLRFWESDILNHIDLIEEQICKLKKS